MKSLDHYILPIALGIAGLVDLTMAFVLHLRFQQLKRKSMAARDSWLRVPAKMLYSRVEESYSKDGSLPATKMFSARFRYEYSIDGKRWEGTQYTLAKEWSSNFREPHAKEVAEFPEGGELEVWVNPRDPSESVLKVDPSAFPGTTLLFFLIVLFGLGLIGAALILGFVRNR